jgi:hypothetical protein
MFIQCSRLTIPSRISYNHWPDVRLRHSCIDILWFAKHIDIQIHAEWQCCPGIQ